MAARKAPPPLSLGVYLPPPPAQPAAQDPADEEYQRAVRRVGHAVALQRLATVGDPAAATAVTPQPTSVQDVIALEREARESTKDARQAAQETAEQERLRRQEAEQRANGAYEAGQAEAENRWGAVVEMQQGFHATVMGMFEKLSTQQIAAAQSEAARVAERMEASNKEIVARLAGEIEKRDNTIIQQQQQIEALKAKKSWGEVVAEQIEQGNLGHPAVKAMIPQLAAPAAPQGKSPQDQLNEGMVPIVLEDERERRRIEREKAEAEKRKAEATAQTITQLAPLARSFLTAPPSPQGRPPLQALLGPEQPQ